MQNTLSMQKKIMENEGAETCILLLLHQAKL